ncbi:MAG: type II secretion system F family protein, partial [Desulfobacterales bacterium]|nr:type II secretion system F family protein [Desulfobacterales bacterium]
GKNITGIIDTESALIARQKLRASNIFPVSINEVYADSVKKESRSVSFSNPFSRVKSSEISMMTRQLATIVGASFPLVSAISTLIPQTRSHSLKKILSQIKDSIEEGSSFAGALSRYPETFSSIYINMVRAGESSGSLEIVLDRLADITEKQQELNNKIRSTLAYPLFMTIFGMLVTFFLLAVIVPKLTSIFSEMHQTLPLITRILISISDILKSFWGLILILTAALVIAFSALKKTEKGRYLYDRTLLRLPVVGILLKKLAVARFTRTLGSLLENGVPMLPALEIVKNIAGNVIISDIIENSSKEVEKGLGVGISLAAYNIFPDLAIQMIQVGEQSGELETMLYKAADIYENEVESSIISMTSLLEPTIILIMGVIVGFIILSIALPIMEMNKLVM